MPFDVDGAERSSRTKVLARTASDAPFGVDRRNLRRVGIVDVGKHHLYGSGWAMPGAVAAFHAVGQRYAIVLDPYGVTYLYGRLFGD